LRPGLEQLPGALCTGFDLHVVAWQQWLMKNNTAGDDVIRDWSRA
jgi:hypothetical protein